MEQYLVTGMSCAACQARVEKAVSKVPGVESCSVSLLTNSMGVVGTASSEDIIKAVTDAGYGASLKANAGAAGKRPGDSTGKTTGAAGKYAAEEEMLKDHETPVLKRRLFWSLGFLAVLMYMSMGAHMFGWPLPAFMNDNHIAMGLAQMLLSGIILVINQKFFISGISSVLHGGPNMDTLVAMGSGVSFLYSTVQLFLMTIYERAGNMEGVMGAMDQFYFESAAMILTLITVGKMLEARSKGKTTNALKGLLKLTPKTANVLREETEITVPADEVVVGDLFVVRPGESIPVDGIVEEGESAVNEAALTGESIPVDKTAGDKVSAATINHSGFLKCRATRVGEDTTLAQIIKMVQEAAATKAPIAKIADRVSGVFVPAVIGIAAITFIVWLLVGHPLGFALERSISVLVISCPCALGLATPVAIMVGNGVGAKNGILFKTAVSLEETGKAKIVVLDKTGTITRGEPKVTDILPFGQADPGSTATEQTRQLLTKAAALEKKSEHPLSRAIVQKAEEEGLILPEAEGFEARIGSGVKGAIGGKAMTGGNVKFIEETQRLSASVKEAVHSLSKAGKTPLLFTEDGKLLGIIAVADTIKEESPQAIRELSGMGIRSVMLTGDNATTAEAIGKEAGVDAVIAGVLPEGKESVVKSLQTLGSVVMVGDGINDAPALTRANIGMAIGAGTDVAIDAADVVLVKSSLLDAVGAIRLSRATLLNIYENLFWAFIYNIIGIPLAAGVWIFLNGWEMNPMFGAAAMSLSSFCVVSNALRLNLFKLHSAKRDRKSRKEVPLEELLKVTAPFTKVDEDEAQSDFKEEKTMVKTTVTVEGMMCPMCEKHVNEAIQKAFEVKSVTSDHTKNETLIESEAPLDEAKIFAVINETGYQAKAVKAEKVTA